MLSNKTIEQKPNLGGLMNRGQFNEEFSAVVESAVTGFLEKKEKEIKNKQVAPRTQFRGRKMKPGRLAYMPGTSQMGIFVCYCHNCKEKQFILKTELPEFMRMYKRDQKRFIVRLAKAIAHRLEAVD